MPGKHHCALPKNFREQFALATAFIAEGLDSNQKCVFVADDNPCDVVRMELRARGLDVAGLEAAGRLAIVESARTPLKAGPFDRARLYEAWAGLAAAAVEEGFTGLRVVVEMTWAIGEDSDALERYEALARPLFENSALDALCVYNATRFSPALLARVAEAH